MRILIADDDPTTLRLVSHAVKTLGHEPITASDGAEALEKFRAEWFPVIITDWEMPELNGIELCGSCLLRLQGWAKFLDNARNVSGFDGTNPAGPGPAPNDAETDDADISGFFTQFA